MVTGALDAQYFQELSPDVRKLMDRRTKPEIARGALQSDVLQAPSWAM